MTNIKSDIESIVAQTGTGREAVIPILQSIQKKFKYLPEEALREVCAQTDITPEQIIGVASFYAQFRLKAIGRHMIRVCVGTACHVKGASLIFDAMHRELKLTGSEETDATGMYTLEKVSCLGCCTLAPVVQIDGITYGHVAPDQVGKILEDFQRQKGKPLRKTYRTAF